MIDLGLVSIFRQLLSLVSAFVFSNESFAILYFSIPPFVNLNLIETLLHKKISLPKFFDTQII